MTRFFLLKSHSNGELTRDLVEIENGHEIKVLNTIIRSHLIFVSKTCLKIERNMNIIFSSPDRLKVTDWVLYCAVYNIIHKIQLLQKARIVGKTYDFNTIVGGNHLS